VDNHLIEVHDISKIYPSPAGDVEALSHVSFNVDAGEFVGVVGKSGAGKSTLSIYHGVDTLTSGSIDWAVCRYTAFRDQRNVCAVDISAWCTNLRIAESAYLTGEYHPAMISAAITRQKEATSIQAFARAGRDRRPRLQIAHSISVGSSKGCNRPRVANDPDNIVADEPPATDSNQPKHSGSLFHFTKTGQNHFMVTHNMSLLPLFQRLPAPMGSFPKEGKKEMSTRRICLHRLSTHQDLSADLGIFTALMTKASISVLLIHLRVGVLDWQIYLDEHVTASIATPKVVVAGKPIQDFTENERARWRGKNLGIVFPVLPAHSGIIPIGKRDFYAIAG
jgi:putative ABC transport system ATP-binding protein